MKNVPDPLVTLTTDFGEDSPYVAAMKGVILTVNPAARLVDLSHQVPPQDVRHAAFFLAAAIPWFPPGAIHVVVVDPGVGSDRALLCIEVNGYRLLAPDNGCWTLAAGDAAPAVVRLERPRYWRHPVSATFHGRDILAPVAGHLSRGLDPRKLGPRVDRWTRIELPAPKPLANGWTGEVVFVDRFGNLLTNLPVDILNERPEGSRVLRVGGRSLRRGVRWVRTYAEARPGALVALASSTGRLEVAVNQGSAARRLRATVGTPVAVGQA